MISDLKKAEGSVQDVPGMPEDLKEVYLHQVELKVDESAYEFPYYIAKDQNKPGSGYSRVVRSRLFRRAPVVHVKGRIAATQDPAAIFQKFVQDCQANEAGLKVEVDQAWKRGRQGKDGTFALDFLPGVVIQLVNEDKAEAGTVTLTDLALDDPNDPLYLLGRGADGVLIRIEKDRISRRQWNNLVKTLAVDDENAGR